MSSVSSEDEISPVKGHAFKAYRERWETATKEKKTKGKETATKEKEAQDVRKEKKANKAKGGKDWQEDKVSHLIELLEERPSLWDVFHKDYAKRDVRDVAYNKIAEVFECNTASIKSKIDGLRAQLGREMGNVNKTKSGQSTDDLYVSNWVHYQSLAFLQPVMKSSSSKNTLKQSNEDQDKIEYTDVKIASGSKKKTLPERKIELLTKCMP